jgi:hypothetical protein
MNEIDKFESEADYIATSRELFQRVDRGELKPLNVQENEPFEHRYFLEQASGEVWILAIPDQAFRGFLKRRP